MKPFVSYISQLLTISNSQGIVRRYFVVNGFDGALTMLGLMLGFVFSENPSYEIALNVCLAAAIALAVSGISSAYVSESSERHRLLTDIEESMLTDISGSSHAEAAKWIPMLVALVNGLSPLVICLLILAPLWLVVGGASFGISPFFFSIGIALILLFLLGVFLGHIAGYSWLMSGARTVLTGVITIFLIYVFTGT